jgi:hypothetical protein
MLTLLVISLLLVVADFAKHVGQGWTVRPSRVPVCAATFKQYLAGALRFTSADTNWLVVGVFTGYCISEHGQSNLPTYGWALCMCPLWG